MKIFHITRMLHGGSGQYALRLSRGLVDAGFDSSVLLAEGDTPVGTQLLRPRSRAVGQLASRGFRSVSRRISSSPFHSLSGPEAYSTDAIIKEGDIVHLHGLNGWIGRGGLSGLIPPGVNVVWTAHDLWMLTGGCVVFEGCTHYQEKCRPCPILKPPFGGIAQNELKIKERFARLFKINPIANSSWTAQMISNSRVFGAFRDIPVINPIVDDAYLADGISDLRQELNLSPQRFVICMGARSLSDPFKGVSDFLICLGHDLELARSVTVLVFGPGEVPCPSNLDVRLLGPIQDPKQLARIYRSSDLFVSPSRMETFGMTLAEARSCGTPVAAFDVGGVRDAVPKEDYRLLVPAGNFTALLNVVHSHLSAPSIDDSVRAQGKHWGAARFSATVASKKQLEFYHSISNSNH